jgi:hypothetical protein
MFVLKIYAVDYSINGRDWSLNSLRIRICVIVCTFYEMNARS